MNTVKLLFYQTIDKVAKIYSTIPVNVPLNLTALPAIMAQLETELQLLANNINGVIVNGIDTEWLLSNNKNDAMLTSLLRGKPLPTFLENRWKGRNFEALQAFKNRTVDGINLSSRVWDTVRIEVTNMEREMAIGIYEGTPASKLASQMKVNLNNPDALFRRVRDLAGELKLSKAAKEFHPGQGVYRSAYKNALRMTRTETNLSYQEADNLRWATSDYVVGVRVRRSGISNYPCDVCEAGVGDYPKSYEWVLFHPNCLCFAVPILASEDEFIKSLDAGERGEIYEFSGKVTQIPSSLIEYKNTHPNYVHRH